MCVCNTAGLSLSLHTYAERQGLDVGPRVPACHCSFSVYAVDVYVYAYCVCIKGVSLGHKKSMSHWPQ